MWRCERTVLACRPTRPASSVASSGRSALGRSTRILTRVPEGPVDTCLVDAFLSAHEGYYSNDAGKNSSGWTTRTKGADKALAVLEIKDLHVAIEDGTEIVRGVDLSVNTNEVHAVMGP